MPTPAEPETPPCQALERNRVRWGRAAIHAGSLVRLERVDPQIRHRAVRAGARRTAASGRPVPRLVRRVQRVGRVRVRRRAPRRAGRRRRRRRRRAAHARRGLRRQARACPGSSAPRSSWSPRSCSIRRPSRAGRTSALGAWLSLAGARADGGRRGPVASPRCPSPSRSRAGTGDRASPPSTTGRRRPRPAAARRALEHVAAAPAASEADTARGRRAELMPASGTSRSSSSASSGQRTTGSRSSAAGTACAGGACSGRR